MREGAHLLATLVVGCVCASVGLVAGICLARVSPSVKAGHAESRVQLQQYVKDAAIEKAETEQLRQDVATLVQECEAIKKMVAANRQAFDRQVAGLKSANARLLAENAKLLTELKDVMRKDQEVEKPRNKPPEAAPKQAEPPVPQSTFDEAKRKAIYKEYMASAVRAARDAIRRCPAPPNPFEKQVSLEETLRKQYDADVLRRYSLTKEEIDRICGEADEKGWIKEAP